jgi:hypothetical protein
MPRIKKLATTATRKRANFMVCSDQLVVSTIKHEDGRGSTHQLRYWKFVGYLQECHSFDVLSINGFLIKILSLELSPSSSPSKKYMVVTSRKTKFPDLYCSLWPEDLRFDARSVKKYKCFIYIFLVC